MFKNPHVRDRGGAAALSTGHRAVALFALNGLISCLFVGPGYGQTEISGGQMRVATNLQNGTSYSVVASDCGKLLSLGNPGNISVTVPQAGPGGIAVGCWIDIQNTGAGTATVTSPSMIDGAVSLTLTSNQGLRLVSSGSTYFTQRGQGSGSGSGGGSALSIQSGGTALGTASTLNVVGGTGVSCVPQVSANVMTFQCNADTSYLASKATLQGANNPQVCTSSSANGAIYAASCASTLASYGTRQTLFWFADMANTTTTPTLNIDTLGAKTLVRQDGTAVTAGDIKANVLYRIWYDGTNIRVVEAGVAAGSGGSAGGGASSTRGLFAARGSCGSAQSGNTYYSTDIAHFSQCDGNSWADYFEGQPVTLPSSTAFSILNGTDATVTTNGISTISAPATNSTNIIGQEVGVPVGTWTIVAWLESEDQGIANAVSPARLLYVRDGTNKMAALYAQSMATYANAIQWVHISSPTGTVTSAQGIVSSTGRYVPFLRIQYDGTNLVYSGCTTYNAATTGGANNFGGGNCERFYYEPAASYIGTPVAVGWGLDTHSGAAGVVTNAVTAIHWQVTN